MTPRGAWTMWLVVAIAASAPAAVRAAIRTYPGPAPCDVTLAACITGATEGDVVQIATNGPIDEGVLLNKSLTVEAAPGFTPQLGTGLTFREVYVSLTGAGSTVVVRGLRMPNGGAEVYTQGTGTHSITVADCAITNSYLGNSARAILVGVRTPATLRFERNDIISNGYAIDVGTSTSSGNVEIDVVGNRIRKSSAGYSSAGIWLDLRGAFNVTARVQSNLVYDVADCNCGFPAGMYATTSDTVQATIAFVNNTIDQAGERGIALLPPSAGQTLVAHIYNNIVTRSNLGIVLPALSAGLVVGHGFNDFFENAMSTDFGGYPPGAGTVSIDPLFVDRNARDYHLQPTSTLVHGGTGSPPGGLPALDADGNVRIAGPGVDYGAFELGSTPPTTTTTVSTTPTTTTLAGCATGASFPSVRCRLAELVAAVPVRVPPGKLSVRLLALAQASDAAAARAEAAAKTRPRKKQLGRAARALGRMVAKLRSPKAELLDPSIRDGLVASCEALAADVATLRAQ